MPISTTTRSCWRRWSSAWSSTCARRISRWAREIADALIAHFEDREHGGFFFVSHDHEALILRHKPGQDTATPSGNGTAALALARLAVIAGEPRYAAAARRAVDAFGDTLTKAPDGFVTLLRADAALRTPPALVIIDGDPALTPAWAQAARAQDPQAIVIDIGGRSDVPAALCKGPRLARDVCAYVCRDFTCLPRDRRARDAGSSARRHIARRVRRKHSRHHAAYPMAAPPNLATTRAFRYDAGDRGDASASPFARRER